MQFCASVKQPSVLFVVVIKKLCLKINKSLLLIKLENRDEKKSLAAKRKMLKGSDVYIEDDLRKEDRQIHTEKLYEAIERLEFEKAQVMIILHLK